MKVRVIRVFRVPDCDTRITQNNFGFCKLLPEIPEQNSGFGYFGFGFGYSGFGFRVTGFLPSPGINHRWIKKNEKRMCWIMAGLANSDWHRDCETRDREWGKTKKKKWRKAVSQLRCLSLSKQERGALLPAIHQLTMRWRDEQTSRSA
jgi:hypothetical protein